MNFSREMEVFQTNSVKSVPYSEFLWFVFSPFGLNTEIFRFFFFEYFLRSVIKEKQSHNY